MKSATLRAGLRSAILAIKEIGEDLNDTQVLNVLFHTTTFDQWMPTQTQWGGRRTAGFTEGYGYRGRHVSIPAGAANAIYEVCMKELVTPFTLPETIIPAWGVPHRVRCVMNRFSAGAGGPYAGECYQGIEIGSFQVAPPWQTGYVNAFYPCVQLRYDMVLERWELCLYQGDGVTIPTIVACDLQPGLWEIDNGHVDAVLEWTPDLSNPNLNRIKAYINGVLVHQVVGGPLTTLSVQALGTYGDGYFMTRGSTGGAEIIEGGFLFAQVYTPFEWGP